MLNKTSLSKINASWHLENKMPNNPTLEERMQWHLGHSQNCQCRPIDPKIWKEIKNRIKRNSPDVQRQIVIDWFESLKTIWLTKNPTKVEDLVSNKFLWSENPFQKSITSKKKLLNEWASVLNQKDIIVDYEVLSIHDNIGIAKWESKFTWIDTNTEVEMKGIWYVVLDANGKCCEFRQWFNTRT
jgi:hypothetical protein